MRVLSARPAGVLLALLLASSLLPAPLRQITAASAAAQPAAAPVGIQPMPYEAAVPVFEIMRDHWPEGLAGIPDSRLPAVWDTWVRARDREIRARLARGDEDALVNLWLYGTSFTAMPPARTRELTAARDRVTSQEVLQRRLDDLVEALRMPGPNERVRMARELFITRGLDPDAPDGQARIRQFLVDVRARVMAEFQATDHLMETARSAARDHGDPGLELAAGASLFQERGFASDTSILPAFGVDQVLEMLASDGALRPHSVRRVAVVGPGLDLVNKSEGYDFYPPQTIQPFALAESLVRLGLSAPGQLRIVALDINPQVNEHLRAARQRAAEGHGYVLQLPLLRDEPWTPEFRRYWEAFGRHIGTPVDPLPVPATVVAVDSRAIRVSPEVVLSIDEVDLNVILARLSPLAADEQFDLVIATNVLVYYGAFEQSLALVNAGAMVRPGGLIITNTAVLPAPPVAGTVGYTRLAYSDRQYDHLFWYRRE